MLERSLFPVMLAFLCGFNSAEASHDTAKPTQGVPEKPAANTESEVEGTEAAEAEVLTEKKAAEDRTAREKVALATKNYWDRCIDVNNRFVSDKSEVWFKEFRPGAVEATCREAARGLRELDSGNVDPLVVEHVNRAIRGYETIGAIAKVKGRQALLRDAAHMLKFIYRSRSVAVMGAYADGGWIEMGLGISRGGRKAATEGQDQTSKIASKIIDSEEAVIKAMREKYNLEIKPW